jgi:hypothetical protein
VPKDYATTATIVSLFPLPIFEKKPLIPAIYQVEASRTELEPKILTVKEGMFHVYLDEYRGMLTIRTAALTIAESVVRDFLDGQYLLSAEARPAIWVVPGEWTVSELFVDKEQKDRLLVENALQLEWFKRLIFIADDEWSKFHQHRMITEVQRIAAARLKFNREWALEFKPENISDCPGCGSTINKKVAVCRECGCIINMDIYKTLQFTGEVSHAGVGNNG